MEQIKPGKYVEMTYNLYTVTPEGETLVHQVDPTDPEKIVFGVTEGVIKPFEEALDGLKKGDTFDIVVSADDAFGQPDPEQVAELDRDVFMVDGTFDAEHVKEGAAIPMMTADGYRITGIVTKVTDTHVTMDFNHPLAGKDVRFKGVVTEVREATAEELHPVRGCCGCSDGCGCGDDCDCSDENRCSDGCGCH